MNLFISIVTSQTRLALLVFEFYIKMSDQQLNDLLKEFKLSEVSLQKQCCDNLFLILMENIPSFQNAAPYFGLSKPEIAELYHDYTKERSRRLHLLWAWRRKNGSNATYLAIVKLFLKMNDKVLAELVLSTVCEKQVTSISDTNPAKVMKYRNWESMPEFEREKVKNTLQTQNQEIREKYAHLSLEILHSLEKQKIKVNDMKVLLVSYGVLINSATTNLADVFLIMLSHSSWFNIQLFQFVVKTFGSDDDKRKMKAYEESELVPYLQRSIFEIPSKSFGPGVTAGYSSLFLYLPDDCATTGNYVTVIRHKLSQLLGITDGILQFIGYDIGSTILIFGVPEALLNNDVVKRAIEKHFTLDIVKNVYTFSGDLAQVL